MKNWILGISITVNILLAAALFYLYQYSRKVAFIGLAMTASAELRQDAYLLSLIESNQNEKVITFLSRNIVAGRSASKMWADGASWVKLPYIPQHIRDMENQLTIKAEAK